MNWTLFLAIYEALILLGLALFYWIRGPDYWKKRAEEYHDFWQDERRLNRDLMRSRDRAVTEWAEQITRDGARQETE